ncbi:hypothetical protein OT109_10290 [Phycisphaeraceae bacterium D3-23]
MSQGWMRVREAAHLMGVSQTTVRRRMEAEELRSRVGRSGRQEVFLPAKLRRALEAAQTTPCPPGHLERAKANQDDAAASAGGPVNAAQAAPGGSGHSEAGSTSSDTTTHDAEPPVPPGIDMVRRYERLAGGSLILAQQHSDELQKHTATAFEQLAHTRNQLREVRRVALTGWACCAAALVFGLFFSITFGVGMSRAQAAAAASEAYAEQAEKHAAAQEREYRRSLPVQAAQQASQGIPAVAVTPIVSETASRPVRGQRDPRLVDRTQSGPTASVPTVTD